MAPAAHSIGVFDSGLGGLSVLRQIRALMPGASLLYYADNAHLPYGDKPAEIVRERAFAVTGFLAEQGVQTVVIACNTATAAAADALRERFTLPIVGMEPGVKPAVQASRSGVVGVLATAGTLGSARFRSLVERHGKGAEVMVEACSGWVEQVEAGDLRGPRTRALVRRHVEVLLGRGADVLVLGCTHYPFLEPLIREVAGPQVSIVDTGAAVARQVLRVVGSEAGDDSMNGVVTCCSSGVVTPLTKALPLLLPEWGARMDCRRISVE